MEDIPEKVYTKWFDYDIINRSLCFRTRQSGDTIVIDRAGHRQKLKAWFMNEKIPAGERDFQPLIADGSRIVWIPGYRMSSAYQVSVNTQNILQIEVKTNGGQRDG
jgi:tRNA(Ile)-lysidine synthase